MSLPSIHTCRLRRRSDKEVLPVDSSRSMSSRTCPSCGARNSDLSLFCAECGAGLNGGSWDEEGQTQAFQPVASSSATSSTAAWSPPDEDEHRAPSGTYKSVVATRDRQPVETASTQTTARANGYATPPTVNAWTSWDQQTDRGARGFVLGTIAWILILAVFLLVLWSSVLSSGLKDDIRDFVPGLSMILLYT